LLAGALISTAGSASAPVAAAAAESLDIDPAKLSRAQQQVMQKVVQSERAYNGCDETIERCLARGARTAQRLSRFVAYLASRDLKADEIAAVLADRKRAVLKGARFKFDLASSPVYGRPDAKVSLVEFADFECPGCQAAALVLKQVVDRSRGKAKLYFKQFPIKGHQNSLNAALASLAAQQQGKFWQMHELLYRDMTAHERPDLDTYARQLGLSTAAFWNDMASPQLRARVERDKIEGMRAAITGTPAVFVNGKPFPLRRTVFHLLDFIEEELDQIEGRK
jgi:protein-disulfide isomerase